MIQPPPRPDSELITRVGDSGSPIVRPGDWPIVTVSANKSRPALAKTQDTRIESESHLSGGSPPPHPPGPGPGDSDWPIVSAGDSVTRQQSGLGTGRPGIVQWSRQPGLHDSDSDSEPIVSQARDWPIVRL
jgi:hypothetical protein